MNQAGGFYGLNADTNMCKPDKSFTWCLPPDYNQEKHPFTCKTPPPSNLFDCYFQFFTCQINRCLGTTTSDLWSRRLATLMTKLRWGKVVSYKKCDLLLLALLLVDLLLVAVDGDLDVLCGVVGGAENGDKRVGGGVERRADWANRCELLTQSPNMKPNISPGEILSHLPLNQILNRREISRLSQLSRVLPTKQ